MGRFAAGPGGAASPLPDSPPNGQRGRCPSREAKSCAKLCEMGLCAPCRVAPAVVLRFSCQRSSVAVPLEARRLGASWLVPSSRFRVLSFALTTHNSQLLTHNFPITCPPIYQVEILRISRTRKSRFSYVSPLIFKAEKIFCLGKKRYL